EVAGIAKDNSLLRGCREPQQSGFRLRENTAGGEPAADKKENRSHDIGLKKSGNDEPCKIPRERREIRAFVGFSRLFDGFPCSFGGAMGFPLTSPFVTGENANNSCRNEGGT